MNHGVGSRLVLWGFMLGALLLVGVGLALPTSAGAPAANSNAGADDPPAQVIIGTLVFQIPTPTRTPTPINVGNFVWDDYDHDGRQDAGEPGLSGVTVQLWNSAKTQLLDSTTTNASGAYALTAPTPGNYRVRVLLPSGQDSFSPKDQAGGNDQQDSDINPSGTNFGFTDTYNFASNLISITTIDAGVIKYRTPTPTRTPTPINIGNFVWDDIDHDGRQDAGEPGLAGVTVQLWNSAKTQLLYSATTNSSGAYTVIAPVPGNYRVRVLLPTSQDSFSPKDQAGGNDQQDSDINLSGTNFGFTDVFNLASNVISTTIMDAGVIKYRTPTPTRTPTPINIGNLVWNDMDGDGRQDAGEPGLAGITVQLWNSTKTQLLDDAVTSASGTYTVIAPVPGNYRIRVLLPNDTATFSPKDQAGGNDQQDSDINPSGLNTGFTDTFNLASNVISTTIMDAGIIVQSIFQSANPVIVPMITLPPPVLNVCGGFRLTSPLDGLPNGEAAFYWDPASVPNVTYQITLMDEARNVLATFTTQNTTSMNLDVSQRAVGGGFQLIVRVTVLVNGQEQCSDERSILRAAPDPGSNSNLSPRATPTPTRPPRGQG